MYKLNGSVIISLNDSLDAHKVSAKKLFTIIHFIQACFLECLMQLAFKCWGICRKHQSVYVKTKRNRRISKLLNSL